MSELADYLEDIRRGRVRSVDWSVTPHSAAQPVFDWLGLVPPPSAASTGRLEFDDATNVCEFMLSRLTDECGHLAWSSYLLSTALQAVADSVKGPPEPFIRAAWSFLEPRSLDEICYNFCRALGGEVLGRYRNTSGWDLEWIVQDIGSPSQICLRYWILGVKPNLWTDEIKSSSMKVLDSYAFDF